jgi:hypothetical protein
MRESKLESDLRQYAESKGCIFYKLKGSGDVGKPDRVVTCGGPSVLGFYHCWGRTIYVELKKPGEKPSRRQLVEHDRIRRAGGIVIVIDNLDDGRDLIDTMCDPNGTLAKFLER